MPIRRHGLAATAVFGLLALSFALPEPADARSYQRRNYAAEWEEEDREDRAREERERARQQSQEHEAEMQQRYLDAAAERQDSYQQHRERQLDRTLDTWEGKPRPAAPAPVRRRRTGSCMYGPKGEVLYQPEGAVCN